MRLTLSQVQHSVLPALLGFELHSEAHLFANHLFAKELASLESPGLQNTHKHRTPSNQALMSTQHKRENNP